MPIWMVGSFPGESGLKGAEKFLKFDFAETKDLCKQFLTLVSGILVFSVTFSQKFVAGTASAPPNMLVASWFLFILAIILSGGALWLMFIAGSRATHNPTDVSARSLLRRISYLALNVAGIFFVVGMVLLICSGSQQTRGTNPSSGSRVRAIDAP